METINDIVREMRKDMPRVVDTKVILRNYADRLEAAIKREREAVGNAAKMREALETISKCDISKEEDCYTLYRVCEAALSAPPRNCDRFKSEYDYDKLHEAFVKHCDSCNCPMGCIHRRDTRCMLDTRCGSILKCFAKFVLAEAEGEQK